MDEMVPVYLVWIKAMTVTVIFLRYEVKDSEKRHFETTPFYFQVFEGNL